MGAQPSSLSKVNAVPLPEHHHAVEFSLGTPGENTCHRNVNHQAVFRQWYTQRLKELGAKTACSVSCHCFEKTSTKTLCLHKQSAGMLPNGESWASEPDASCCGPVCAPAWPEDKTGKPVHGKSHIIIIMYIYLVLINVLSTNMLHINLSTIFYMHV